MPRDDTVFEYANYVPSSSADSPPRTLPSVILLVVSESEFFFFFFSFILCK